MTSDLRWTFHVTGALTHDQATPVLAPYEVIVESGVRDPDSPYALRGVGAIARPDAGGWFKTSFVTQGAHAPPEPPSTVGVFVRESQSKWQLYVVAVPRANVHRASAMELFVDLGLVNIGPTQLLYAGGAA